MGTWVTATQFVYVNDKGDSAMNLVTQQSQITSVTAASFQSLANSGPWTEKSQLIGASSDQLTAALAQRKTIEHAGSLKLFFRPHSYRYFWVFTLDALPEINKHPSETSHASAASYAKPGFSDVRPHLSRTCTLQN